MFFLPLIGPILQGLAGLVTPFFSMKTAEIQAAADVTKTETTASVDIIKATNDDIALRVMRDAIILPIAVWCLLGGWDTIVALRYPELMFHVASFPPNMSYYPYAVLVFLFGNIGINMWSRR